MVLSGSARQLLPGLVAGSALIQPDNIHRIQFDSLDLRLLAARRACLIWADHVRKRRQSWVILEVRIDGILHRSILLEIVLVYNRILLCDLFLVRTRTALEVCLLVALLDSEEHVVAIATELHLRACLEGRMELFRFSSAR